MEQFDLGLAYVWEYDVDFIALIEDVMHNAGFTTFQVSYHNIKEVTERIQNKDLSFEFYFDRAWDVEDDFESLGKILARRKHLSLIPTTKFCTPSTKQVCISSL